MIRFFLYISVGVFFAASLAQAQEAYQEQRFFETLYDVPVMQGLEEVPEMALSFDKPNGRIAEAGGIVRNVSAQAVMSFYKESLLQMGWTLDQATENNAVYMRKKEKLSVYLDKSEASLVVRFTLEPVEA